MTTSSPGLFPKRTVGVPSSFRNVSLRPVNVLKNVDGGKLKAVQGLNSRFPKWRGRKARERKDVNSFALLGPPN